MLNNRLTSVLKKLPFALLGSFLLGIGIAFNASTGFGNDPIGLLYDGVRSMLGLAPEKIGLCAELSNYVLIILLLFVGRRYVNIGTFVAVLPYRLCMSIGMSLYVWLFPSGDFSIRLLGLVVGCLLLYTGIAVFLNAEIGMEPITGVLMVIRDRTHLSFLQSKWLFDFIMLGLGWLLGGQIGAITFVTAVIAGPIINFISIGIGHTLARIRKRVTKPL